MLKKGKKCTFSHLITCQLFIVFSCVWEWEGKLCNSFKSLSTQLVVWKAAIKYLILHKEMRHEDIKR